MKSRAQQLNVPIGFEQLAQEMIRRIESDHNELYYYEALLDVLESVGCNDIEMTRSALLSRVAARCPWLLDRVALGAA